MKKFSIILLALLLTACDLVSPDKVINPNVDESAFLNSDNPMQTWANGTEKELASAQMPM